MKWLLMPGMDGTGRLFAPLIQAMPSKAEAHVIRYPMDASEGYASLTSRVMEALPDAESFVMVAESFSGPIAIQIAQHPPPNLVAVVLCATFARNPVPAPKRLATLAQPLWFRWMSPTLMATALLGAGADASLKAMVVQTLSDVSPDVMALRSREVMNVDVSEALAQCAVPMLYLQAKHDRVVWPRSLRHIQRTQARVNVAQIDGPHLLLQRNPEACVEAIQRFLDVI